MYLGIHTLVYYASSFPKENLFQKMLTAELVYTQATEEFCS